MESRSSFRARFGSKRILWQAFYACYCLGLEQHVPLGIVTALDEGPDTDAISKETGIRFFTLEGRVGVRGRFAEQQLDRAVPEWEAELEAAVAESPKGEWLAVSSVAGSTLDGFSRRHGLQRAVLGWESFNLFSAKTTLQRAIAELSLPGLRGRWLGLSGCGYRELSNEFGARFVLQREFGSTGSGTAFVGDEGELATAVALFSGEAVWAAPYASGLSFNVNGVATATGVVVAYPSVQVVGEAALRSRPGAHCGNDFTATAAVPGPILGSIREQTERIGQWMATQGFRGLFGLDFVLKDGSGDPCVVDLNPRWQGSTSLQAQAALRQGRLPLAAAELAYRTGVMEESELLRLGDSFFAPVAGSQVFPKTPPGGYWRTQRELRPGIIEGGVDKTRPGLRLEDLETDEELLLNGMLPRCGRAIAGGQRIARLCSLRRVVDPATGRLEPYAVEAIGQLEAAFELTPAALD